MAHYEAANRGAKASAKKLLHRLSGGRSVGNAPDAPEMDEVSTGGTAKRAAGGATAEGAKPRGRMAKKGGSGATVNVIVAGAGQPQPHPVPVPVPVGGARPGLAGPPPGAPPAGMPPRPMPPGMPAQKRGGRVRHG